MARLKNVIEDPQLRRLTLVFDRNLNVSPQVVSSRVALRTDKASGDARLKLSFLK